MRPVAVGVGVVVGQREQQEVEEVLLDQVGADAAGVLVADAGQAELRAARRLAAGEDVGVEELLGAHDGAAEDRRGQPRERGVLRGLVLVAPAVHQVGGPGRAHPEVVERLEDRGNVLRQVRGVHVVDRVGELLHEPEAARGAERRAVLDVAALVARVPVHRRDVVGVLAHAGGDRGRARGRHAREGRGALVDIGPALHHGRHRRRAPGGDGALEHRRLQAVDDGEHELGAHRRMRRPACFSPSRRRPPSRSQMKKPTASTLTGGMRTDSPAIRSAAASA